jgi:hypothetical protein
MSSIVAEHIAVTAIAVVIHAFDPDAEALRLAEQFGRHASAYLDAREVLHRGAVGSGVVGEQDRVQTYTAAIAFVDDARVWRDAFAREVEEETMAREVADWE